MKKEKMRLCHKLFVLLLIIGHTSSQNYAKYRYELVDSDHSRQRRDSPDPSSDSPPLNTKEDSSADEEEEETVVTTQDKDEEEKNKDDLNGRGWLQSNVDLKEIDVPEEQINKTIETQKGDIQLLHEHYKYYNSTFVPFNNHSWVDLDVLNQTESGIVKEHSMLSHSYRRAATIRLRFKFPFYGHLVDNITIATGGFLYTGDYVHSWLAATQYIAPLMANFDTSQEESAKIRYADNGTALVVEWENVYLKSRESGQLMEGPFTFQAILHYNGDIIFAYKTIPFMIQTIADEEHPVKVGLSDAYIMERTIFFVRRKTIYEYHRVNMKDKQIANLTAIYLKALPTCNMKKSCDECVGLVVNEQGKDLNCMFCPGVNLCSDGMDRNRQTWINRGCDNEGYHLTDQQSCVVNSVQTLPTNKVEDSPHFHEESEHYNSGSQRRKKLKEEAAAAAKAHHVGIASISVLSVLAISVCGWFIYAYFFPHTWSGQFLIRYRPSRWQWRRGEARYTAASIHM